MTVTQPLTQPVDLAAQLQLAQAQLIDTARKIKAVAIAAFDQAETADILTLADDVRRAAAIAGTHVADLQSAATRQALRSGQTLPPDASAGATVIPSTTATQPPAAATDTTADATEQPTVPYRVGGFLQEPNAPPAI